LHVSEIAASENQRGGRPLETFAIFEAWLERLDCSDLFRIHPLMYWDIAFHGHALWGGDPNSATLEVAIHNVIHPEITFDYTEHSRRRGIPPTQRPAERRWLNAKCDVQAVWSHIHAGNDVFVTEDRGLLRPARRSALLALGAGDITTPEQASSALTECVERARGF